MCRTFFLSGFFVVSALMSGCKDDDPTVKTTFDLVVDAPVTVKSGEEKTIYVYKDPGVTQTRYANKITFTVPANISQVHLTRFTGSTAPKIDEPREVGSEQFNNHQVLAVIRKSQSYTFAPGIGLKLNASDKFDVGMKVINPTTSDITSLKSSVSIDAPETTVTHEALPFIFYNTMVSMPPGATGKSTYSFKPTEKMNVVMLSNFSSKYITYLEIYIVKSGVSELVYTSKDWENPLIKSFDPLVLNPGDALKLEATYTNPTNHTVHFGDGSDDDFTGAFGYYYKD